MLKDDSSVTGPGEEKPSEVEQRLRRCIRDLIALSALPAGALPGDPGAMATSLAHVLLRMLGLSAALIQFDLGPGSDSAEHFETSLQGDAEGALELERRLRAAAWAWPAPARTPTDDLRMIVYPVGLSGARGRVAVAAARPDFPSEEDRLLLGVAVNQSAIALERQAQAAALATETQNLEAINEIGVSLISSLNLEHMVQSATDAATKASGAEFGAFLYNVVNDRGESYVLYALSGVPRAAFEKLALPRNTALFGPVYRGERIIRLDDVTTAPEFGKSPPHYGLPPGHPPVRSFLAVPVMSRSGEVLGGLFFGHQRVGMFTERAERVVAGIAGYAAVAIENARLYEDAQRREERFRALVATASTIVWTTDPTGAFVVPQPQWQAHTGQAWPEHSGWGWAEMIHPDDRANVLALWRDAVREGKPHRSSGRLWDAGTGDYRQFVARAAPVFKQDGSIREWIGAIADAEEHRQAQTSLEERVRLAEFAAHVGLALTTSADLEDSLQRSAECVTEHLGAAFAGIWTFDPSGETLGLQASAGLETEPGGPRRRLRLGDDRIGQIALDRAPYVTNDVPGDPQVSDLEWAGREGVVAFAGYPLMVNQEVVGVMAVFARQPLSAATLQSMSSVADEIGLAILRCRAEAELKNREAQLRALAASLEERVHRRTAELRDRNERLLSFSYSVSHDLRAPVRAMEGYAGALLDDFGASLNDTGREYIQRIREAARRMDRLIHELLEFSRLQNVYGALERVDVKQVIMNVLEEMQAELVERQATVELVLPEHPVEAIGRGVALAQAVSNLVGNAAKFCAPGTRPRILVRAEDAGVNVRLVVEDNGIGIEPRHRDRIFGLFERLHGSASPYSGTGVGLAMVKQATEGMGGQVGVESRDEGGSRFWITLPKWQPETAPTAATASTA